MRIYYDTKTNNVSRFVDKIKSIVDCECIKIDSDMLIDQYGHLITYTTSLGMVPTVTKQFLDNNSKYIISCSSSGNSNWGANYGKAAVIISEMYGITCLMRFELSGTHKDVKDFIKRVYEIN